MRSSTQASFLVQPILSTSDALLVSIFVGTMIHAFIIPRLNFTIPLAEKINQSIEITLAITPSKKPPKKAKFLAQENQVDAGKITKKPIPFKPSKPSQGEQKNNKSIQPKTQSKSKSKATQKLITQIKAKEKIITKKNPTPQSTQKEPTLSAESLTRQITQFGKEIRYGKPNSEKPKIKFVNDISTYKSIAVQYQKDWKEKIWRIGSRNYPDAARHKNFTSPLTMDVGISADGSITGISIIKSSGNKALDSAAKHIVMRCAPFPPLPRKLLEELDILRIRGVWNFSDESFI